MRWWLFNSPQKGTAATGAWSFSPWSPLWARRAARAMSSFSALISSLSNGAGCKGSAAGFCDDAGRGSGAFAGWRGFATLQFGPWRGVSARFRPHCGSGHSAARRQGLRMGAPAVAVQRAKRSMAVSIVPSSNRETLLTRSSGSAERPLPIHSSVTPARAWA